MNNYKMRDRDKQALWAEIVYRLGEASHTDEEWEHLYLQFVRSWDEGYGVIMLKEEDIYGAVQKRQSTAIELQGNRKRRLYSENIDRSPQRKHQRPHELGASKSKWTSTTYPLWRQQLQSSEEVEESLPLAIWQKRVILNRCASPSTQSLKCEGGRLSLCSDQTKKREPQKKLAEKRLHEHQEQIETEIVAKRRKKVEEMTARPSASGDSPVKVVSSILEYMPPNEFLLLPQISDAQVAHMPPTAVNLTPTKSHGKTLSIPKKNEEIVCVNDTVGRTKLDMQSICNSISFDHNYNRTHDKKVEFQSSRRYNGCTSIDVEIEEQLVDDALEMTSSDLDMNMDICEILGNITGEIDKLNFSDEADHQLDMQLNKAANNIELCIRDFDNESLNEMNHQELEEEATEKLSDCRNAVDQLPEEKTPLEVKEDENNDLNYDFDRRNAVHQIPEEKTPLEVEVDENNELNYDFDDDDDDVLSVAASYDFEEDIDELGQEMVQQDKTKEPHTQQYDGTTESNLNQLQKPNFNLHELKQQPEIMQSLYKSTERKPRTRASRFSALPAQASSSITTSEQTSAEAVLTTPAEVSQQRAQALAARRPSVCLPLFAPPYRRPANSDENTNAATMSFAVFNGSKYELYGIKCWNNLDSCCSKLDCNHQFHSVGEVVSRLMRLEKSQLLSSYFDVIDSSKLFQTYFTCYADVFANRRLFRYLTQMIADCRLYRQSSAPFLSYIYTVLQQCGEERDAVSCMMRDLWLPSKAHQYRELTATMLKILASANWSDYMAELIDLFKTYRFPMPNDFMTEIVQAAIKKKELLQQALQLVLLRRIDGVHDEALIRVLNMIAHSGNSPPLGNKTNNSTATFQHHHPYSHPPPNGFNQVQYIDPRAVKVSAFGYTLATQNGVSPSYTNAVNNF